MASRIAGAALVAVVLMAAAVPVHAQSTGVNGVVQRVDVPSRTLYLTDGRSVILAPGARVVAAGREIDLGEIQPGWMRVGR